MNVKTTLLIFFLACLGLCAQTPPTVSDATDAATRDEILRRAVRDAILAGTNTSSRTNNPAVVIATKPTVVVATNSSVIVATNPTVVIATNSSVIVTTNPAVVVADNAASVVTNIAAPAFPSVPAFPPNRRFPRTNAASNTPLAGVAPTNYTAGLRPSPLNPVGAVPPATAPPAAVPAAVPAAPPAEPEQIIGEGDIDFPAAPLESVLEIYAKLVGRTILRAQLPPVTITLKTETPLTKSEAIQALVSVLAMNGITIINVGDKFVKVVPTTVAPAVAQPFNTNDETQLLETDQYVTHIVQLKYAKTSDVMPALTPFQGVPNSIVPLENIGVLIIRDYASNVKRMLELLKQIDITVPLDFDSEVIPIRYAQASDIASALSSLGGGTGTTIGHGGTTGGGGSRTGGGLGGTGGYGGTAGGIGGSPGFGSSTTGISSPGAAGGAARTSTFGDRLNQIVKNAASSGEFHILGQTKIIADQRTNSLLVFADKQDMAMIKKIVGELDIVLAQVLIEAIIMEVTLDRGSTVGFNYNQVNPSSPGNYFSGIGAINNGTFLNAGNFQNSGSNLVNAIPGGFSYAANFGNDFQATVTAIATDDRIQVLSRPRIQTSHGVAAEIQVGNTVPEVTGTYFGGINGQASSQYQQTFVGIDLKVTPLINPDGLVVMDIFQDVEQLGPTTTIDGNPVPTTSKRTANATVSVRDRDTIILGGMISNSKSTSHSGVPFLKDIPGLGYLFRSSIDSGSRVELVILIRPTVLPTPAAAALVAAHERDKLPAIKASERENRLDENRRLKESDKIQVPKERD